MPKKLLFSDYTTLADSCGLVWCGERIPKSSTEKTCWRCLSCNRQVQRSYHNVKRNVPVGCSCQTGKRLSLAQYQALEGYIFIGTELPPNAHTKTWWIDIGNQEKIFASYAQIAYKKR